MSVPRILIVAAAPGLADHGAQLLESVSGLSVSRLSNPRAAAEWVTREPVDLLVLELPFTAEAASLVRTARSLRPDLSVLGLCCSRLRTEWSGPLPRFDCDEVLVLPFEPVQFVESVRRLCFGSADEKEPKDLAATPPELAGSSPEIVELRELVDRLGPLDVEVLIQGPVGSPRGIVARRLHALAPQQGGPFVSADCRLTELDHCQQEDSFATAKSRWRNLLSASAGGVLFLDHVDHLPRPHQAILQSSLSQPAPRRKKLRLLSATEVALEDAVENEGFRRDLFYRLSPVRIEVPPLVDRRRDIFDICQALLGRIARHTDRPAPEIGESALELLASRDWPGDVAELEHVIETAAEIAVGCKLEEPHVIVALERMTAVL